MHPVNLVVLRAFGTQMEADMAKSALESANIDVMIQADSAGGMRPHLAWGTGGFKLLVREEDVDAALAALDNPGDPTALPPS
jgi:hypothetical protein